MMRTLRALRECPHGQQVRYLGAVWRVTHGFRGVVHLTRDVRVQGPTTTYWRSVSIDRPSDTLVEPVESAGVAGGE